MTVSKGTRIKRPEHIKSKPWITPPALLKSLNDEFRFDMDPCPCPRPDGFNSLVLPWGNMNYVNPPFNKWDGPWGGPTAFARKAISELKQGKSSVLILPVFACVAELVRAGADMRSLGRVEWLDADTGVRQKNRGPECCLFILKPNK